MYVLSALWLSFFQASPVHPLWVATGDAYVLAIVTPKTTCQLTGIGGLEL